jgi:hypothetical protein
MKNRRRQVQSNADAGGSASAAKAKGIPINYEELYADLCYWGNNVKARWAREYWGAPEDEETAALALSEATP